MIVRQHARFGYHNQPDLGWSEQNSFGSCKHLQQYFLFSERLASSRIVWTGQNARITSDPPPPTGHWLVGHSWLGKILHTASILRFLSRIICADRKCGRPQGIFRATAAYDFLPFGLRFQAWQTVPSKDYPSSECQDADFTVIPANYISHIYIYIHRERDLFARYRMMHCIVRLCRCTKWPTRFMSSDSLLFAIPLPVSRLVIYEFSFFSRSFLCRSVIKYIKVNRRAVWLLSITRKLKKWNHFPIL